MNVHVGCVSTLAEPHTPDQRGQTFHPELNCSFCYKSASDLSPRAESACSAVSLSTPPLLSDCNGCSPWAPATHVPWHLYFSLPQLTQWNCVVLFCPTPWLNNLFSNILLQDLLHRLSCCVMQMSLLMVLGICQCSYLYRSSGFGPYICRVLKEISGRIETGSLTIYLWMICEQGKSSSKLSAMNY